MGVRSDLSRQIALVSTPALQDSQTGVVRPQPYDRHRVPSEEREDRQNIADRSADARVDDMALRRQDDIPRHKATTDCGALNGPIRLEKHDRYMNLKHHRWSGVSRRGAVSTSRTLYPTVSR